MSSSSLKTCITEAISVNLSPLLFKKRFIHFFSFVSCKALVTLATLTTYMWLDKKDFRIHFFIIIQVFNKTQPIPILHLCPLLCVWIHFRHHHDHVTTTPEQNHIYVQINNHVFAIVSSVINLSSLAQQVLLILH
jgi:hypothetical protein